MDMCVWLYLHLRKNAARGAKGTLVRGGPLAVIWRRAASGYREEPRGRGYSGRATEARGGPTTVNASTKESMLAGESGLGPVRSKFP